MGAGFSVRFSSFCSCGLGRKAPRLHLTAVNTAADSREALPSTLRGKLRSAERSFFSISQGASTSSQVTDACWSIQRSRSLLARIVKVDRWPLLTRRSWMASCELSRHPSVRRSVILPRCPSNGSECAFSAWTCSVDARSGMEPWAKYRHTTAPEGLNPHRISLLRRWMNGNWILLMTSLRTHSNSVYKSVIPQTNPDLQMRHPKKRRGLMS